MRRFLARRSIGLVEDAGDAVTDLVRVAARRPHAVVRLRAWFHEDTGTLRVEVTDADGSGEVMTADMPVVAALSTRCGTGVLDDGPGAWFEMETTAAHLRPGRVG